MPRLDKQELISELRRFSHRKLVKGEVVLLSLAIANQLPLLEDTKENIGVSMVKHFKLMEHVYYTISEHAGFDPDSFETIKTQVTRFLLWRTSVANGSMPLLFSGEHNTVIDDMSGMLRFLDTGVLCSVGDIAIRANSIYRLFSDVVGYSLNHLANSGQ